MFKVICILATLMRLLIIEITRVVHSALRLVEYVPAVGWWLRHHLQGWYHLAVQLTSLMQAKIGSKTSCRLVYYLVLDNWLRINFVRWYSMKIIHSVLVLILHFRCHLRLTLSARVSCLVCCIWWEQNVKLLHRSERLFLRTHEK